MRIEVNPVCGIEELTRFEDHFTNMSIYMPMGSLTWFPMEDEDIHIGEPGGSPNPSRRVSIFY
jgi:hypothetical protein